MFDPAEDNQYLVHFVGTDLDTCKIPNADTLSIRFTIKDPANATPQLSIMDQTNNEFAVKPGEVIDINLLGIDTDNDFINLEMIGFTGRLSGSEFSFQPSSGNGQAISQFIWSTNCEVFSDTLSNTFEFSFMVQDDFCVAPNSDTLNLLIHLEDVMPDYNDFLPPNIFTPNGDSYNDFFYLETLPEDNCKGKFKRISIYNRWGRVVFSDTRRDFRWDGKGMPGGVYYYHIEFTNDIEYTGVVSILY